MTPAALFLAVTLSAAPAPTGADVTPSADWPQWRGPNRDGKSGETGLLKTWPGGGPRLLWSLKSLSDVGTGYGSPAVVGDKIYMIGGEDESQDAKEYCICLNVADGKLVWKAPLDTSAGQFPLQGWGRGPRSTPTVDGDHVYAIGVLGDLVCLTRADGKLVWRKNLKSDFGGTIPQWGYSESPLIDGDHLICTPGNRVGMVCLDKKAGGTVWECKDFRDAAGYSSVVPTVVGTVRVYVQQTMNSGIVVRASDGKLLWKGGEIGRKTAVIPTPVVSDGYVFYTSGYNAGCECFKLEPDGEGVKVTKVYSKYKSLSNHHGGVIAIGDHVYGYDDIGRNWVCLAFKEAKDEPVWASKKLGKGSITYADGHLYCYSERDGELVRIRASSEDWEESGRFKIPSTSVTRKKAKMGTGVWPHPVVAQDKLFLRDYEYLFCYDLRDQ